VDRLTRAVDPLNSKPQNALARPTRKVIVRVHISLKKPSSPPGAPVLDWPVLDCPVEPFDD
jgi:hypothetical protein